MGIYTVHLKPGTAAEFAINPASVDDDTLLGVKIIREGFSWTAFIFGPLWLLWHRLWLALLLYALFFALVWGLPGLDEFTGSNPFAVIVAHLYLGFEAHSLREWKLDRIGFQLADIVFAKGADDAARRFFKRMVSKGGSYRPADRGTALKSMPGSRRSGSAAEHDVLGLFSRPEF